MTNRFLVHLSNSDDIFISANLTGNEVDLKDKLQRQVLRRHGDTLAGVSILHAFKVS